MTFVARYPWFFILVALLCASCASGPVTPTDATPMVLVTTSLTGVVVDEVGMPMAGVTVTAHGRSAQTNLHGAYEFNNVSVPRDRACMMARAVGYYTAARTEWPRPDASTTVSLTMQKATIIASLSSDVGGTVTCSGATLRLPANGFVTSTGRSYTGSHRSKIPLEAH